MEDGEKSVAKEEKGLGLDALGAKDQPRRENALLLHGDVGREVGAHFAKVLVHTLVVIEVMGCRALSQVPELPCGEIFQGVKGISELQIIGVRERGLWVERGSDHVVCANLDSGEKDLAQGVNFVTKKVLGAEEGCGGKQLDEANRRPGLEDLFFFLQ